MSFRCSMSAELWRYRLAQCGRDPGSASHLRIRVRICRRGAAVPRLDPGGQGPGAGPVRQQLDGDQRRRPEEEVRAQAPRAADGLQRRSPSGAPARAHVLQPSSLPPWPTHLPDRTRTPRHMRRGVRAGQRCTRRRVTYRTAPAYDAQFKHSLTGRAAFPQAAGQPPGCAGSWQTARPCRRR